MDLIKNYEDAVNAIIVEFKKKHDFKSPDGYWIGGLTGEVYDFGDTYTFDFRDVITDIKENAPTDEIFKWHEYNMRIWGINNMVGNVMLHDINYRSWLKGCPRVSKEELDTIENKWKKFIDEVAELGKTAIPSANNKEKEQKD